MDSVVYFVLLFFIIVILSIIGYISYFFYLKVRKQNAFHEISKLLKEVMEDLRVANYKIVEVKNDIYDIKLETVSYNYYIKIIYNFSYADICINNPHKWAKGYSADEKQQKYFSNIYKLVDFEPEVSKKENIKMYLIYKGCRTIMRYVNECEMQFVYPYDLVDDFRIVTYNQLESDHSIIEGR